MRYLPDTGIAALEARAKEALSRVPLEPGPAAVAWADITDAEMALKLIAEVRQWRSLRPYIHLAEMILARAGGEMDAVLKTMKHVLQSMPNGG